MCVFLRVPSHWSFYYLTPKLFKCLKIHLIIGYFLKSNRNNFSLLLKNENLTNIFNERTNDKFEILNERNVQNELSIIIHFCPLQLPICDVTNIISKR